jgi:hypothetical protein
VGALEDLDVHHLLHAFVLGSLILSSYLFSRQKPKKDWKGLNRKAAMERKE